MASLTKSGAASSAKSGETRRSSSESEKLGRAWRALASSIVMTTRTADKLASCADGNTKELDDAVEYTLRSRSDFRRYVAAIEATLMGQVKETEALAGLLQSQPRLGRKRKRTTEKSSQEDGATVSQIESIVPKV